MLTIQSLRASKNFFLISTQINSLMFAFEDCMFVTIKRERKMSSRPSSSVHTMAASTAAVTTAVARGGLPASSPMVPSKKPQPLPRKRLHGSTTKPVPRPRHPRPPPVTLRHHENKENRPASAISTASGSPRSWRTRSIPAFDGKADYTR